MTDTARILGAPQRFVLTDGDAGALAAALRTAQPGEVFVLEGAQARDKAAFMATAARAFAFPDYFGANWDAFADSFDELHWRDVPVVVVVADADTLLADAPDELEPLLRILHGAFAPNPELPQSSLKVVLVGTTAAPIVDRAQRLAIPVARL